MLSVLGALESQRDLPCIYNYSFENGAYIYYKELTATYTRHGENQNIRMQGTIFVFDYRKLMPGYLCRY